MSRMKASAKPATNQETLPFRVRQCEEINSQIVHDSIHRRPGWTQSFLLELDGLAVGFGSIAVDGPWKDKPTLFEFYVQPACRTRAFDLFEVFLIASGARFFETQSNDVLQTAMVHTYGLNLTCEKIVFRDELQTSLAGGGAILRGVTDESEVRACMERRQGGGEWVLELGGADVGRGGILFHYNRPYGDIYMEVNESFRRHGFGAYLVQELKRVCRELGAIPCARCNPSNSASRRTLSRAGFVPFALILTGSFAALNEVGSIARRDS